MKVVVEKLIMNYFGSFIKGIESDKLSVSLFSGNFQMENITLNEQFFDKLNTPYQLAYSSIGKLSLQVPISKIASTPVQCVMQNIYVVFKYKEEPKQNISSDHESFLQKKQSFERQICQIYETYIKKLREQEQRKKQDGMVTKLGKKIIDNLQLKIKNVHFRFEEKSIIKNYSWGITLEEVSFQTTNKNWQPAFIDRSGENNRKQKLFKKMNLKSLSFYWNSMNKGELFLTDLTQEDQKKQYMRKIIHNLDDSILCLTSEVKLVHNLQEELDLPLYELQINLDPIKFELSRKQVLQIIHFAERNISQNQEILKNLSLKKKKMNKQKQITLKNEFEQFYSEYLEYIFAMKNKHLSPQEIQLLSSFDESNINKVKKIFDYVQIKDLVIWALKPIRKRVKIDREKQLKRQKKGWFGGEYQLTSEEIYTLQKFVEQQINFAETARPQDCLFFSLKTKIQGGYFTLVDHKKTDEEERIEFMIGQVDFLLKKSLNDAILDLDIEIEKINLDLILPHYQKHEKNKMNIFKSQFGTKDKLKQFLSLRFLKKVQHGESPKINTKVKGQIKRVIVVYKKIYMKKFQSFFSFNDLDEITRKNTMKTWEKMLQSNHSTELKLQENNIQKHFDVKLNVISPALIFPLEKQDCWCLNLGKLQINSINNENEEIFPMNITQAYFRYYSEIEFCFKDFSQKGLNERFFSVIKDIDFTLTHKVNLITKSTKTVISLPNFQVKFTEAEYKNLLTLKNIFKIDEDEKHLIASLKNQRLEVEKNMKYSGKISIKDQTTDIWKKYFGILSKGFLHLYGTQKQIKCISKINIKHSKLEFDSETNVIALTDRYGSINQLKACQDSDVNIIDWRKQIQLQMKQYMSLFEIIQNLEELQKDGERKRKKTEAGSISEKLKNQKTFEVFVNKITLSYLNGKNEHIMSFQLQNFLFQQSKGNSQLFSSAQISSLKVIDSIYKYRNQKRQRLISVKDALFSFNRDRSKKTEVAVKVTQIQLNWKPDVLVILLQLLKKHISKQKIHRVDDDQQKSKQEIFESVANDSKFKIARKQYENHAKDRNVKDERKKYLYKNSLVKQFKKISCKVKKAEVCMIHRQSHLAMFKIESTEIENEISLCQNEKFVWGTIRSLNLYETAGYPKNKYEQSDQIEEFKLITAKGPSQSPLVSYSWSSFNSQSFPNRERVNSFLYIEINSITCVYFQQVTFRLIDYILIQIILLLNQPQMLIVNEGILEQLMHQKKGEYSEVDKPIKVLFDEYESMIKKVIDPYFMDICFRLIEPSIVLASQKKEDISYRADFTEIAFNNQHIKSSRRFKQLHPYTYEEEYMIKATKCEIKSCSGKNVEKTLINPVNFHININKLIMEDELNILYPEIKQYDRSFRIDSKIDILTVRCTRQQYLKWNKVINFNVAFNDGCDESWIHNYVITKLSVPKPIYFALLSEGLQIQGSQSGWKLFDAKVKGFKLTYERKSNLCSAYHFWLGEMHMEAYQYSHQNDASSFPVLHFANRTHEYSTDIKFKLKPNGEKLIEANIQHIHACLHLHLLQLILQWTFLHPSVFPTINPYIHQLTFYVTAHQIQAQLLANQQGFLLAGFACYRYLRKENYSQQFLQQQLRMKEISAEKVEGMGENSSQSLLLNIEVFEVSEKKRGRKIGEKFTFNLSEQRFFKLGNEELCLLKSMGNRKLVLDRCVWKLSFPDIDLLKKITHKIQIQHRYVQFFNQKAKKAKKLEQSSLSQSRGMQKLDVEFEFLSLYMVNSARIPVMRLQAGAFSINKCYSSKKSLLKGSMELYGQYFNNKIFKWEPMVEGTEVQLHQLSYESEEQLVHNSCIQATKPININISEQMVMGVRQMASQWSGEHKGEKWADPQAKYVIRNQIGYCIDIFDEDKQKISSIHSGEEVTYQTQYEEKDVQILVGIGIQHPKYKFHRITHIPLCLHREISIFPLIHGSSLSKTKQALPANSLIIFNWEVKDSKLYLNLKSTKKIQTYIDNRFQLKLLPFDHADKFILHQYPHNDVQVSLFKKVSTDRFRYEGHQGTLTIKTKYLVYNYTPIPLHICKFLVDPGQFAAISDSLSLQNLKSKDFSPFEIEYNEKKREYYVGCHGYVVDYCGLFLTFGYDNSIFSHERMENGRKVTIYILPDVEARFKVGLEKKGGSIFKSSTLLKPIVGREVFTLEHPSGSMYDLTMHGYLKQLSFDSRPGFIKVIELTPAFILSNTTSSSIKVCQVNSFDSITLEPEQRLPFLWESKQKPRAIKIALLDDHQLWGYSGAITIDRSTRGFILRNNSQVGSYKLISTEVQATDTVNLIHFIENQQVRVSNILLCNEVEGVCLKVYQTCIFDKDSEIINPYDCYFQVKKGDQVPFGFELPLQNHQVTVELLLDSQNPEYKDGNVSPVLLHDIQNTIQNRQILIYREHKLLKKLFLMLKFEGNVKKLKVVEEESALNEESKKEFFCKVGFLGISLIGYRETLRKQLIYLYVQGLNFEQTIANSITKYDLLINDIHIENQQSSNPLFPRILETFSQREFFINFMLIKDNENSKLVHYIGLSINNFKFSITSDEVQCLQQNINTMLTVWKNEDNSKKDKNILRDYKHLEKSKPTKKNNFYFIEAEIHPLKFTVTFKHVNNWGGSLLKTFSSIDDCNISVDGKKITHFRCKNISQLLTHVITHYKDGTYETIIPLIGNLSILGSPVSLAQRIGSGFKDLIELPSEGFSRNPLEGGKGLAKGAGSLMKNTFEGAFNSAQSISGSVGNGISSLAFDDDFSKQRQKIKNEKSQHIGTGLISGAKSIANGVGRGVVGVITSPVEGAQEDGIGGFFLGGLKGLAGLVVKPVSGIFDATTKTFEGIKNTPGFLKQIGNQKERKEKIRSPRTFYTYFREFRKFDKEFAFCAKVLTDEDQQKYEDLSWYGYYALATKNPDKAPTILLTYEMFVIYDFKQSRIINAYKTEDIRMTTAIDAKNVQIRIFDRKRKGMGTIDLPLREHKAKVLEQQLNSICKHIRPIIGFDYKIYEI